VEIRHSLYAGEISITLLMRIIPVYCGDAEVIAHTSPLKAKRNEEDNVQ